MNFDHFMAEIDLKKKKTDIKILVFLKSGF
jgi:hypothetical protein